MKVAIDRFEGALAVCEIIGEEKMIQIERARIPEEAKEGDVLLLSDEGISIETSETEKRKKDVRNLLDSLWE